MRLLKRILVKDKVCFRLLLFWVFILSIAYSSLSLLRHIHFQSGAFDLGIFDQTIWQYAHFLSPINTIKEKFILGDHLNLTLPFLAPLYWVWQDVKLLLIFQAFFITFSAIPIYKVSRIRKFSPFVSLCLSFIYSLFFGIQFAVFFDFHPIVIGVGLLTWFIYFFEAKNLPAGRQGKKLFWIFLTLILLTQENMGIALSGIGLIYLFKKEYRKPAILFIVGGLIVSLTSVKIVGLLSQTGYQYWPSLSLNPIQLLSNFFDSPEKRLVWLYSFSWFTFLPILSPGTILAVFLDLSQYFIPQKQFGHMVTPFLHHRAILAPLITLGLFDVLLFLKKKINISILVVILVLSSISQQFIFHFPLNKISKLSYWQNEQWMDDNRKLFTLLPKGTSVAASQNLVSHLSQRKEIYLVYPRIKDNICKGCWWLEFAGKPEYLVVDLHPNQWVTQLLESNENFQSAVKNMEKKGKIAKFKNINNAYIYKINYK
ncbi:MAG: hypothetical protein A2W22_00285 [Candidatus Levybacteria bacterium RBG_16_35_11]|nr:MAG: hypothetical protein A2W22_00285 [Candidatus Levybacteria bacterium RBG_16_35_11]